MIVVGGKPHVRPCASIPADGNEGNDWIVSISDLYAPLTTPLPLAGASMLTRTRGSDEPRIASALRAEAPWMGKVIDSIADQTAMQLWAGRPWLSFRPTLLIGPPGAGKTHLARRIGDLSGCGSAILSLAGVSSNAELAGSPSGFRHPQPCFPAMAMLRTGTANPVVIIDEVEKANAGNLGDPVGTLLGLLERSTARRFFDGCVSAEVDLSHINWILTANSIDGLPAPLLSRVEVVEVTGPRPEHAEMVLAALWRDVARDAGLPPSALPRLEAGAETMLLRLFRNTRSVRQIDVESRLYRDFGSLSIDDLSRPRETEPKPIPRNNRGRKLAELLRHRLWLGTITAKIGVCWERADLEPVAFNLLGLFGDRSTLSQPEVPELGNSLRGGTFDLVDRALVEGFEQPVQAVSPVAVEVGRI